MIRPLAVLLVLAVTAVGGWSLLPTGEGVPVPVSTVAPGAGTAFTAGARPVLRPDLERRAGTGVSRSVTRRPAAPDEEFTVTLDALSPAVIPRRGPLRMSGTVTNTSDETWTDLNIHPFTSYSPMTTVREVEVAVQSDPEMAVGERIVAPGAFDDSIRVIAPGDTLEWSVRIPRDVLVISEEPGVYWIGVHVLGATEAGRDGSAHGRARSLIVLPERGMDRVPTSLVVPVRQPVHRDETGRITGLGSWTRLLRPGGRFDDLAAFARRTRDTPITWLVDPAVLDAVAQLAAGNPPRSLRPTEDEDADDQDADDAGDPDGEEPEAGEGTTEAPPAEEEDPDPDSAAVQPLAEAWLATILDRIADHRVLGLPYGDLDVAASTRHAAGLLTRARDLSTLAFEDHGLDAVPAIVPPTGLLPASAVELAARESQVFLSADALPASLADEDTMPSTIAVGDARVAITDDGVARGGPGPDDPHAPVALRQRLLAGAAVRSLAGEGASLQVVLPARFTGRETRTFLRGLEQGFIGLAPAGVDSGSPAPEVPEPRYPETAVANELGARHLAAVLDLVGVGHRLDSVLPRTDEVAHQVTAQALCAASYHARRRPLDTQVAAGAAAARVRSRLDLITIDGPAFVILSSESGPFAVTMGNGLDETVRVRIAAHTGEDLTIRAPAEIEIAPESQQTVQLNAEARSIGVHSLRLVVTDPDGNPIGAADSLSVRTNSVGRVIWVVLGIGVGILFLAIPVRLWRRFRKRTT